MIERKVKSEILRSLENQAAVAIIGPRQVGKTTVALEIAADRNALYLDLEDPDSQKQLRDPKQFLQHYADRLVILDEVHQAPELFKTLRGLIDRGRREGRRTGRFLILGSASVDLWQQSESLAGRIAYVFMDPLHISEVPDDSATRHTLWMRGGYPDSYLAADDLGSRKFRQDVIRTYLHRDVSVFGFRLPAVTLANLWTRLAQRQGSPLNASEIAAAMELSSQTVTRYVDLLTELLLVRRLRPLHRNLGKSLVKRPRVYVRDSGMLHALLNITDYYELTKHQVLGASWEGFVIENLLQVAPFGTNASFYRTRAGAEIDLILEQPRLGLWAIEIKHGLGAKPRPGFRNALADLKPDRAFVVYPETERHPIGDGAEAISLREMAELLAAENG